MQVLTEDQIKGMLDRFIAVIATLFLAYLVRRGIIGESESAMLFPAVILLPSLAWGWWVNRNKALVQSAANVPGTVVVTTESLAKSTPETNIVSNTTSKVISEAEVVTEHGAVLQQPSKEPLK